MRFPELAQVTPEQALAMLDNPDLVWQWVAKRGVKIAGLFGALDALAEPARAAEERRRIDARRRRANRRRRDLPQIVAFMERAATRLPARLHRVYDLCIDRGLSLDAAARPSSAMVPA